MKYFLRKTKKFKTREELLIQFDKDMFEGTTMIHSGHANSESLDYMTEKEIPEKDKKKQVRDKNFDKTQVHICRHEEGEPCELIDL